MADSESTSRQKLGELTAQLAKVRSDRAAAQLAGRRLAVLNERIGHARSEVQEIRAELASEQRDVERLGGMSWSQLAGAITPRDSSSNELERERADVLRVQMRLQNRLERLVRLEEDAARLVIEANGPGERPEDIEKLMTAREDALVSSGSPAGVELAELAKQLAKVNRDAVELDEAGAAADAARSALDQLLVVLRAVRGWATQDVVDARIVVDRAKYGRLDEAQRLAAAAQWALDSFAREALDVGLNVYDRARPEALAISSGSTFTDEIADFVFGDVRTWSREDDAVADAQAVNDWLAGWLVALAKRRTSVESTRADLMRRRERLLTSH